MRGWRVGEDIGLGRVGSWLAGVVGLAALALAGCGPAGPEEADLYVYVGGTMRPAMEELVRLYEARTGLKIYIDYGGSGENMIKVETTGQGDLYVAHDPFHAAMVRKGLAEEGWWVASLTPVIAVPKGNPKGIRGLKDLTRPGLRLVLTHPEYSTVGHIVKVMFKKAGIEEAVKKNIVTRTRGGGEAANQVVLGHVDAAIVWDAVVYARREKLDAVPVEPAYRPHPVLDAVTSPTYGPIDMSRVKVTIDLLKSSRRPDVARRFAEFVASDEGAEVWKRYGFTLATGPKHLVAGAEEAKPADRPGAEAPPAGSGEGGPLAAAPKKEGAGGSGSDAASGGDTPAAGGAAKPGAAGGAAEAAGATAPAGKEE